jgi:osmotically-inducible protein OsmY
MIRDDELRQDVIRELEWEPSIEAAHIGVACRDGVVMLSGHVQSYAEKAAAERAVRRVRGVTGIAMAIDIHLPTDRKTADDEIAGRALKMLRWDTLVQDDRIKVEVEGGIVTLTGTVPWHYQKLEAEADVRKLTGVRGVVNSIVVRPEARPQDVRDEIHNAFLRNAELDASSITIGVLDGKVVLGGKVNSWIERELAERAAWSAPGVAAVEDHIVIGRP